MAEHPAVAFLLAAHARTERLARAADAGAADLCPSHPVEFVLGMCDIGTAATEAAEAHIRAWMPADVLRRVAAERKILAEHTDEVGCCSACAAWEEQRIDGVTEVVAFDGPPWPCRTVLLLAEAWGWTGDAG